MQVNPWALAAVAVVAAVTYALGQRSARFASSSHDFLLARRTVRSRRNAAAVTGEYLSAASFLGVAGVVLTTGVDALWYPIGFAAGYLALTLFVAAPLRRSGAYTLPDFLEARLGSQRLRKVSTGFVVGIGVLYLVPQLQGAGIALGTILPQAPVWVGPLLVMVLVTPNVVSGGMRSVTVVQAFQYWLKLFAIGVPAFVLCGLFFAQGIAGDDAAGSLASPAPPVFSEQTTVEVRTPVTLTVEEPTRLTASGTVDGAPATGMVLWSPAVPHQVGAGTTLTFPAGTEAPIVEGAVQRNSAWLLPDTGDLGAMLGTYSLIFATFLGTMGLPHVLVRFYTNPDGKSARRTTVHVLLLLGVFYLFPTLIGALSRMYAPELLVTGRTDAAVLSLPTEMLPGVWGQILAAVTAAGAFAAFLATSAGLLVSLAGVISTDLLHGRVRDFKLAALIAAAAAAVLAVGLWPGGLSVTVAMSFALAASTFCPLLLLGIWWQRLTWKGALAGMVVGGGLVMLAVAINIGHYLNGTTASWYTLQPALFTVPAAFATTILISRATRAHVPGDVGAVMLRMHAPDPFGLGKDRAEDRFGKADEDERLRHGRHRRE